MSSKRDRKSIINSTIAIIISVAALIGSATLWIVHTLDAIDAKSDVRATEISDRLKVIEGFLREKYPEFSNFARKESLSRFDKEIARLIVIPADAQRSVGTLNRIDPLGRLIAVENTENLTESFHITSGTQLWVWVPNLRRVRRVSGLVGIPLGSAVVVVYAPSGREARSVVYARLSGITKFQNEAPRSESSGQGDSGVTMFSTLVVAAATVALAIFTWQLVRVTRDLPNYSIECRV